MVSPMVSCTDKSVETYKPPPVEKMDSGHKLLEKTESGHKLLEKTESEPKLTPVGVDSVIKPLDAGPTKVTIASQTSLECEPQSDHVDSPPPLSPPITTANMVSIQCFLIVN